MCLAFQLFISLLIQHATFDFITHTGMRLSSLASPELVKSKATLSIPNLKKKSIQYDARTEKLKLAKKNKLHACMFEKRKSEF